MSIPVFSSITTLLSGTVSDQLRALLKPFGMVVAAIFLALNLVLVFPTLMDLGLAAVLALEALPLAWQSVIGALALFVLGYLVSNFSSAFVAFLSGDTLRDWPGLNRILLSWQQHRFRSLSRAGEALAKDKAAQAEALYRLAYEFPREETDLAPTALGNALANVSSYTWHQYGIHLDTVWPVMTATLKAKDADLGTRLANNRTALEFLASLAWMVALVAAELLFLPLFAGQPRWAWIGTACLLGAAYLCYRACVRKAMDWGRDARAAFDQHLDELADSLDMPQLKSRLKKVQWEAASRWLLYGAVDLKSLSFPEQPQQDKAWYEAPKAQEAQEPSVVAPATVTVQKHHRVLEEFALAQTGAKERRVGGLTVDYVFMVTNEQSGENPRTARGVSLLVSDPRLLVLPEKVKGELSSGPNQVQEITGHRQPGGPKARDALLWHIGYLPPGTTRTLHYSVKLEQTVRLWPKTGYLSGDIQKVSFDGKNLIVHVKNSTEQPKNCRLRADGFKKHQLPASATRFPPSKSVRTEYPSAEQGSWTAEGVPPGGMVSFVIKPK